MYKSLEDRLAELREDYRSLRKEYAMVKEFNIPSILRLVTDRLEYLDERADELQEEIDNRYTVKISYDKTLDLQELPTEYRTEMYEKLQNMVEEGY